MSGLQVAGTAPFPARNKLAIRTYARCPKYRTFTIKAYTYNVVAWYQENVGSGVDEATASITNRLLAAGQQHTFHEVIKEPLSASFIFLVPPTERGGVVARRGSNRSVRVLAGCPELLPFISPCRFLALSLATTLLCTDMYTKYIHTCVHFSIAAVQWMEQATGLPSCLLYTSPSPRDRTRSRMPSSA